MMLISLFQTTFVVDEVSNIIKEVTYLLILVQFEAAEPVLFNVLTSSYCFLNELCYKQPCSFSSFSIP